ncbi:MAG: hypothetical protein RL531_412 [Actinomycetota bacterium]|jgi:hypothetical protein
MFGRMLDRPAATRSTGRDRVPSTTAVTSVPAPTDGGTETSVVHDH